MVALRTMMPMPESASSPSDAMGAPQSLRPVLTPVGDSSEPVSTLPSNDVQFFDSDQSRWLDLRAQLREGALARIWLQTPTEQLDLPQSTIKSSAGMFEVVQRWEGVVVEIDHEVLRTELVDLTDPTQPKADANFPRHLVEPGDEGLLEPGALFYFTIGKVRDYVGAPTKNGHRLRFRRVLWTRRDMTEWEQKKSEWRELLGTHDQTHAARSQ